MFSFGFELLHEILLQANGEDSDDDDDYDDYEAEETALESYQTPLDVDDCAIDEYQVFKNLIERKFVK